MLTCDLLCSRSLLLRVTSVVLHLSFFFSIMLKTVKALFFLSIATLPRYVSSKLCCSFEYLGLFGELVVNPRTFFGLGELMLNPRTFFGLCCKDWGSRGDLSYVWCRGHWCSQALILIELTCMNFLLFLFVPVTHIHVCDPGNQIELPGRKLVVDSRVLHSSVTVVIVSPGHPQSQAKEEYHQEYPIL
ncbi:hypothetical protein HKD37_18G050420 [Glycine soja]